MLSGRSLVPLPSLFPGFLSCSPFLTWINSFPKWRLVRIFLLLLLEAAVVSLFHSFFARFSPSSYSRCSSISWWSWISFGYQDDDGDGHHNHELDHMIRILLQLYPCFNPFNCILASILLYFTFPSGAFYVCWLTFAHYSQVQVCWSWWCLWSRGMEENQLIPSSSSNNKSTDGTHRIYLPDIFILDPDEDYDENFKMVQLFPASQMFFCCWCNVNCLFSPPPNDYLQFSPLEVMTVRNSWHVFGVACHWSIIIII